MQRDSCRLRDNRSTAVRRTAAARRDTGDAGAALRVTHCPVNVAGIPWANVQALAAQGGRRAARRLQPRQAPPRGRLVARAATAGCPGGSRRRPPRSRGCFRRTDVFHFYFGLTLVPKSLQFPLLRATRRKSVFHYLGSDIRGKTRARARLRQARGRRDRRLLRRAPLGARRARRPARPRPRASSRRARRATARARSSSTRRRTARRRAPRYVIEACAQLPVDLEIVEGVPHDRGARALRARRHRRRPAERRLARRLRARGDGARQAGRLAPQAGRRRAERRGLRRPRPDRAGDEGDARRRAPARSSRTPRSAARSAPRAAPTSSRCTTSTASPTACSTSTLACRWRWRRSSSGSARSPRSTASAGSSRG